MPSERLRGASVLAPSITDRLIEALPSLDSPARRTGAPLRLTERESEVLRTIGQEGCSNAEERSDDLPSEATVKTDVGRASTNWAAATRAKRLVFADRTDRRPH